MTTTAPTTIDSKKPNTKQELIAANIKLLIEQLEAGHSDAHCGSKEKQEDVFK